MLKLVAKTTGRLQIALIDLNGSYSNRVDGSIGLTLKHPETISIIEPLDNNEVLVINHDEANISNETVKDTKKAIKIIQEKYKLSGVKIGLKKCLPLHSGFGSKTQSLLSIAAAYCQLNEVDYDYRDLAQDVGRGGTSGIGVEGFNSGGFIVDCGHDFDQKDRTFRCSGASKHVYPPPIVGRYDCPRWPILVVTPNNRTRFFGNSEVDHWKRNCPIPLYDAQACAHIALMMMIPAVIEDNLGLFCNGINKIQTLAWKRSLIDAQSPTVRKLFDHLRFLGLDGIGLSSAGPTVYALGASLLKKQFQENVLNEVSLFLEKNGGGNCIITFPNNNGAKIEKYRERESVSSKKKHTKSAPSYEV